MATKKAKIRELKTIKESMRRFVLNRTEDETGTSGTGVVATGVQFPDGHIAMTWLSHMGTYTWYNSIEIVKGLHGHQNKTEVVWLDKECNEEKEALTEE